MLELIGDPSSGRSQWWARRFGGSGTFVAHRVCSSFSAGVGTKPAGAKIFDSCRGSSVSGVSLP